MSGVRPFTLLCCCQLLQLPLQFNFRCSPIGSLLSIQSMAWGFLSFANKELCQMPCKRLSFGWLFSFIYYNTYNTVIEQVSAPVQYICSNNWWQPFEGFVSLAKRVTFKALGMHGLLTRDSRVWFLQKTKSMPKGCPALGAFYDICMETQNWSLQVSH